MPDFEEEIPVFLFAESNVRIAVGVFKDDRPPEVFIV
jgi:hypothetical protein